MPGTRIDFEICLGNPPADPPGRDWDHCRCEVTVNGQATHYVNDAGFFKVVVEKAGQQLWSCDASQAGPCSPFYYTFMTSGVYSVKLYFDGRSGHVTPSCYYPDGWTLLSGANQSVTVNVGEVDLDIQGVGEAQEEYPGAYLFVNNDDDNGNSEQDNDEPGTVSGENDLLSLTLSVTMSGMEFDSLRLSVSDGWPDMTALWTDATRGTKVTVPATYAISSLPKTLYLEGILPCEDERDVTLTLQGLRNGQVLCLSDTVKVTVMGLSLWVNPNPVPRTETAAFTASFEPGAISVVYSNWHYDIPNLGTVYREGDNNVSTWSGSIVAPGTCYVTGTAKGRSIAPFSPLPVQPRPWATPTDCKADNKADYGNYPDTCGGTNIGAFGNRGTHDGSAFNEEGEGGALSPGYHVGSYSTGPGKGPNAGLWYIFDSTIVSEMETLINQHLKGIVAPPDPPGVAYRTYLMQTQNWTQAQVDALVNGVKGHENCGVNNAGNGHYCELTSAVHRDPNDQATTTDVRWRIENNVKLTEAELRAKTQEEIEAVAAILQAAFAVQPTGNWTGTFWYYSGGWQSCTPNW